MKYKVAVNLNRIDPLYLADFELARQYYLKHGVDITWNFKQTDLNGYTSVYDSNKGRWLIQGSWNLVVIDPTADVNMFVFDEGEWATPPGSQFPLKPNTPSGSCLIFNNKPFVNVGVFSVDHTNGQTWIQIAHELMHSLVQNASLKGMAIQDVMDTYYLNFNPDAPNGNFARQWDLLKSFLLPQTYTYFTLTESTGTGGHTVADLKPELVALLDKARGIAGIPFKITSGYRTPQENTQVGGVPNSAHTTKEAADVACSSSGDRLKMVSACLQVGFTRIEIGTGHIHLDISKTLPQNVMVLSENS